jgi:hypothetical protein
MTKRQTRQNTIDLYYNPPFVEVLTGRTGWLVTNGCCSRHAARRFFLNFPKDDALQNHNVEITIK